MLDLRLYGPSGDVEYDLEPEGGAFTHDGAYYVNFQDNNGYAIFNVATQKYLYMAGYGSVEMQMDASDKDDMVNIKDDGWGASPTTRAHLHARPDGLVHREQQVLLHHRQRGRLRDGENLIGVSGDFEGEELRFKDFPNIDCTNNCKENLGILTSSFMPSDYAENVRHAALRGVAAQRGLEVQLGLHLLPRGLRR